MGMNIKETMDFFEIAFKHDIVPLLLGHTGIGKTEVIREYAQERGMDFIAIYVSQLEPSDFLGYAKIEGNKTVNCQPSWLPDNTHFNPKGGIVFLDEINRGHEDIRQALFQFITNKRIHTYSLPDNYKIVCAANPSGDYEVYDFDDALRNRFAWIAFKPDFEETMTYLSTKYKEANPVLLKWISTQKDLIDYGSVVEVEPLNFSPRILEKAVQISMELSDKSKLFQRKCLETIMKKEAIQSFMAYLDELAQISYKDILSGKNKTKVKEVLEAKRLDILSTLTSDLSTHFAQGKDLVEKEVAHTIDFLLQMPDEIITTFVDSLRVVDLDSSNSLFSHKDFKAAMKDKLKGYKEVLATASGKSRASK